MELNFDKIRWWDLDDTYDVKIIKTREIDTYHYNNDKPKFVVKPLVKREMRIYLKPTKDILGVGSPNYKSIKLNK